MTHELFLSEYPWIKIGVFEDIFRKHSFHHGLTGIIDFELTSVLKPGENYGSQILRATVQCMSDGDTNRWQKSMIIKASLGLGSRVVRSVNVFEKEIYMFLELIPNVERVLGNGGIETKIAPTCFLTNLNDSYLILEDLSTLGFSNVQRTAGLDFDHLNLAVVKLARWHAATVVLINDAPQSTKLYEKPHVRPTGSLKYRYLFENAVSSCAEAFRETAGFEAIVRKLLRLEEKVYERCCTACSRDITQFNVLNHGDLWANNVMYSYDECGKPNDILMIDFQMGYWGSPVLDLTYLLFTSSHAKVNDHEWEQLYRIYYEELKATLIRLKYGHSTLTFDELYQQIVEKGVYSAMFAIFSVTMRLFDEVKDNDDVLKFFIREEQPFRVYLMQRPHTRTLLTNLLMYFDKMGYLDVED